MGNRAVIRGLNQNLGVYVHWNGGYDSVYAFTQYCKLQGYRSPETDDYGIARLAQVIGNFFGGTHSVGIWNMSGDEILTPEKVDEYWLDNGVYELENWEIVKHWNSDLISLDEEYHDGYDLTKTLLDIDSKMPKNDRLTEDFIKADVVNISDLKIGDEVFVDTINGWELHKVAGFGTDMVINGSNRLGVPYVDLYRNDGDYTRNPNNYLNNTCETTIRRKRKEI